MVIGSEGRGSATVRPAYRLVDAPAARDVPALDDEQRRVVEHDGGPLLVLAGPGTGKTTTLVEAIARRIEQGARPDEVLALTFSRKAAEQLRDRVTARVGRTMSTPLASTFHSYGYGLLREFAPAELYDAPLRLLSAPEQDVILRELLVPHPESVPWPADLDRALGTRGFASEVHAVLSRAREKGLDGAALSALGEAEGAPELVAAGRFLEEYLTNLDAQGAVDYSDLIRRATIEAEQHQSELRARLKHVFVDEYQDTDPGQVALLRALAGDGRDLVVVGDPHQSIYGFRGAEVRGILEFPHEFRRNDGGRAPVIALRTTRRFGPRLLVATQRVAGRIGLPGSIDEDARQAFLAPSADAAGLGRGRAQVLTFDTERAEAEHLADLLRRAHLEDGVPWSEMAVLVRSGRASIPPLRRALAASGVPVEVASDDLPLVRDPAVLPLLEALRVIVDLDRADRRDPEPSAEAEPDGPDGPDGSGSDGSDDTEGLRGGSDDPRLVTGARVEALLTGPLGGLDAGDVRRLARRLRVVEKADAAREDRTPRASRELIRALLTSPALLDGLDRDERGAGEVARARSLVRLIASARSLVADGGTAEEALWALWSGTRWPARLRRGVDAGGAAARRAHRDLDAICALFEVAQRAQEQRHHVGVRSFLATLVAQQIPGDTLAERGVRGPAVRLLTAHRSKGLEWRVVVVAHVQDGAWPDLRRRSTLLRADRIGTNELVPPVSTRELLAEERRLFYVACTRARQRLIVTAVASPDDEGERPSRFLDELGVTVEEVVGRPHRPLSLSGLVAELRRTLADPASSPALRDAAARRLARLAGERGADGSRALAPEADPATWWGTRALSRSAEPVRDPASPVAISASVLEQLAVCPTRWFLNKEAGGVVASHQSANVGQIVHALAERVATGELLVGEGDVAALMTHVDAVWDRLEFRTPWSRAREHARVRAALERFLTWHHENHRTLLRTEARFDTVVGLPDGEQVRLIGYADRLELDHDGCVVVVDLKTNRSAPTKKAVADHLQLGLYQYAVDHGAVEDRTSGGAELIQLGLEDGSERAVVQSQEPQAEDGAHREALRHSLQRAAVMFRHESFPAVVGNHCRECSFVPICPAKSSGAVVAR